MEPIPGSVEDGNGGPNLRIQENCIDLETDTLMMMMHIWSCTQMIWSLIKIGWNDTIVCT